MAKGMGIFSPVTIARAGERAMKRIAESFRLGINIHIYYYAVYASEHEYFQTVHARTYTYYARNEKPCSEERRRGCALESYVKQIDDFPVHCIFLVKRIVFEWRVNNFRLVDTTNILMKSTLHRTPQSSLSISWIMSHLSVRVHFLNIDC